MTFDPRLLIKAAGPGRIRDTALKTWRQARQQPRRSGAVLRGSVRRNRSLHSRERRLVQEALFGMVRTERGLAEILGTDAEFALWLGWLVLAGLDPDVADAQLIGAWDTLRDEFEALGQGRSPTERLALRHSLPDDLARRLVKSLGAEPAEAFLQASDQRGPVAVRANRLRCDREALAARLAEEGVPTEPSQIAADGLRICGRHNLEAVDSFKEGWFEVQDEGSQRLAALVEPEGPVIDFCAGAGGKSLALAAAGVPVMALDVRGEALEELDRRATRAGADVDVQRISAQGPLPDRVSQRRVGRVLVDAPCSGSGVLRRHPEHRYLIDRRSLSRQSALQRSILERACPLVADGGRLIYGTCSVLREENDRVIEGFLDAHPGWSLVSEPLRMAPHTHDTDGFFGAVLQRP